MSLSQQLCRAELLQMKPNVKAPTQLREFRNIGLEDHHLSFSWAILFSAGRITLSGSNQPTFGGGRKDLLRFRNRSCIHICVIYIFTQQSGLMLPRACFTSKHSRRWDGLRSLTLLLGQAQLAPGLH